MKEKTDVCSPITTYERGLSATAASKVCPANPSPSDELCLLASTPVLCLTFRSKHPFDFMNGIPRSLLAYCACASVVPVDPSHKRDVTGELVAGCIQTPPDG